MTKPKKPPRKYEALKSEGDDASTRKRVDVHETITAKIVAAIEAGAGEFQMPWHRPGVAFILPKNALTEKTYRGSNILSLWIDADEKKFEQQTWATFKQWQELGAQVRKGEKGSLIVKYGEWIPKDKAGPVAGGQPKNKQDADEDGGKRLFAKAAWVFNVQQVDGFSVQPAVPRPDLTERLDHVDAFIAATKAEFREGGQRAFYRHRDSKGEGDFIQMPPRNLFTGTATSTPTESFESTRLHELGHWSHAAHRLNFEHGQRFGDHTYAFNELIAELSAAFLCAELEITNTPRLDHAQYCANWLIVLKGDTKAIFSAASLATRTVDYLIGLQPKPVPDTAPATQPTPETGASGEPPRPKCEITSDRIVPKGPR
jgi:antirestriction protein ArdC